MGRGSTRKFKIDGFAKSRIGPIDVIPAQAGIYNYMKKMDSRLRGNDMAGDFLRNRKNSSLKIVACLRLKPNNEFNQSNQPTDFIPAYSASLR